MDAMLKKDVQEVFQVIGTCPDHLQSRAMEILLAHVVQRTYTDSTLAGIKALEDKLNTVGDDAQLANIDLQNALQKQQQTLQMMSNISKTVNDTVLAVIRKIGG